MLRERPRRTVRVFDEPEAHLHPTGPAGYGRALQTLRHQGNDVVIGSHSEIFMNLPGWTQVHVSAISPSATGYFTDLLVEETQ